MTADGTPTPRTGDTITTTEALDALPVGSVVLAAIGRQDSRVTYELALQRFYDGDWYRPGRARSADPGYIVPATVLFRPDAPQPAATDDAVERAARAWHQEAERQSECLMGEWDALDPGDRARALRRMRAALAAAGAGAGAQGWPEQIARAVAVVRAEAASYEAVSRTGAESLYDDESDMPERMVDRLMDAGLITSPTGAGAEVDREALAQHFRQHRAIEDRLSYEAADAALAFLAARGAAATPTVTVEQVDRAVRVMQQPRMHTNRSGDRVRADLLAALDVLGIEVSP